MGTTTDLFAADDSRNLPSRRSIEVFVPIDLAGATIGAALVVVANGLWLGEPLLWLVLVALLILIVGLIQARRLLQQGWLYGPLLLTTLGNWLVAVVVATALPQLWPAMILTVLMPVVLATPYVSRQMLRVTLVASAVTVGLVAAAGLINDDGGAISDMEDELEFALVIGALMALIAVIALIVWQNNRLQQRNLDRATDLNVELLGIQEQLAESRRRVVEATDAERLRIERDLHDGAQQGLVALGVQLRLLDSRTSEASPAKAAIAEIITDLDEAVEELRELAHGIYPPLLRSGGLVDALTAVSRRSPVPVQLEMAQIGRTEPSIETALYFTALEALTNVAKHTSEAEARLSLDRIEDSIVLEVADTGDGFDIERIEHARGTQNMEDRIAAVGGQLTVSSHVGRGTTVVATVPVDR